MDTFEREERYVVIKLSHLNGDEQFALRNWLDMYMVKTIEGLVVEADWPEYEPTWAAIEARVKAGG